MWFKFLHGSYKLELKLLNDNKLTFKLCIDFYKFQQVKQQT